jgi:hypothetical protein
MHDFPEFDIGQRCGWCELLMVVIAILTIVVIFI